MMIFTPVRLVSAAVVIAVLTATSAVVLARQAPGNRAELPQPVQVPSAPNPGDRHVLPDLPSARQLPRRELQDQPSDDEIWNKFIASRFTKQEFQVEKIAEEVEACKDQQVARVDQQMIVGVQTVHRRYKCTIKYAIHEGGIPHLATDVVYIDKDVAQLCTDPSHNHGNQYRSSAGQARSNTGTSDQERRLVEVEKKLDAILKKLDGSRNEGKPEDRIPR
jgi:hypothetical protein